MVPVCFVYDANCIYTPIDSKPKSVPAGRLKRVRNIIENPRVSLVIDEYSEDWSKLYYIIIHGRAELLYEGQEHNACLKLLSDKYKQYIDMGLEALEAPVIKITPEKIISWQD